MDMPRQRLLHIECAASSTKQIGELLNEVNGFVVEHQAIPQPVFTALPVGAEGLSAILLDITTSYENQVAYLEQLCKVVPNVPVLFLANEGSQAHAEKIIEIGAQDYLPKHLLNRELLQWAIENAIKRHQISIGMQKAYKTPLHTLIERLADGILIVDQKGVIHFANPAAERLFDMQAINLLGTDFGFPIRTDDTIEIDIWKHDDQRFAEMRVVDITWQGEDAFLVSLRDVTERIQAEKQMRYLATHDALTGLPNRILFFDRLRQALARAIRQHSLLAVFFLDVDHFKQVNDAYGHGTGDQILQAVALRLEECLRKSDTVARMGGDEFTIILESLSSVDDCVAVAKKILEVTANPFVVKKHEFRLSTSIGISLYPIDGKDADNLVNHADTAMYVAKQDRNHYCFYSEIDPQHYLSNPKTKGTM